MSGGRAGGRGKRGGREGKAVHTMARPLVSVNHNVAIGLAHAMVEESARAVRDQARYKDVLRPAKPPRRRRAKTSQGPAQWQPPRVLRIDAKFRRDRPWLSARELRQRAREDLREREVLPVRHRFAVAADTGPAKLGIRPMRIIDSARTAAPHDLRHIQRVRLPPVAAKAKSPPPDVFGVGDRVRLKDPRTLAYGGKLLLDHDSVGEVLIGGRQWKGDCLVAICDQRIWAQQEELVMVERSVAPRPSTGQEAIVTRRQLARDRKRRLQAQNLAKAMWQRRLGDAKDSKVMIGRELDFFFEQFDVDGSGFLDSDEVISMFKMMGLDLRPHPHDLQRVLRQMDPAASGKIDLPKLRQWWKRSGVDMQEQLTRLNDQLQQTRDLFEDIDVDRSGLLDRGEMGSLVKLLGFDMSPAEIDRAMAAMDTDGSGEIDFQEFWKWWTDDSTRSMMQGVKRRVNSVKQLFDTLDVDCSGTLQPAELAQLAKTLGAELTAADMEEVLDTMAPRRRNAVRFFEFYRWWNSNADDVLARAKEHAEARAEKWRSLAPIQDGEDMPMRVDKRVTLRELGILRGSPQESAEEAASSAPQPRTRRCTVDQIALMVGADEAHLDSAEHAHKLLLAAEQAEVERFVELLRHGADPKGAVMGVTPLMVAAANGHLEIVQHLLRLADAKTLLGQRDMDGLTAADWAQSGGHTEVLDALRSATDRATDQVVQPANASSNRILRIENDALLRVAKGDLRDNILRADVAQAVLTSKQAPVQTARHASDLVMLDEDRAEQTLRALLLTHVCRARLRHRERNAVHIQALARGFLARAHLLTTVAKVNEYRDLVRRREEQNPWRRAQQRAHKVARRRARTKTRVDAGSAPRMVRPDDLAALAEFEAAPP